MQYSYRFLRFLSVLFLLIALCGCSNAGRQTADPNERYAFIIDLIRGQEVFSDRSDYFDIAVEMAKIDDGYRYYITLDNPRIAMYDVELLAIEDGVDYMNTMAANVGIFEEREYHLVPNQSNPKQNYMKGVVASAVTSRPETTLYIFVQFKNADYSAVHSEYFRFDVSYQGE
jgi:hypothetical protein